MHKRCSKVSLKSVDNKSILLFRPSFLLFLRPPSAAVAAPPLGRGGAGRGGPSAGRGSGAGRAALRERRSAAATRRHVGERQPRRAVGRAAVRRVAVLGAAAAGARAGDGRVPGALRGRRGGQRADGAGHLRAPRRPEHHRPVPGQHGAVRPAHPAGAAPRPVPPVALPALDLRAAAVPPLALPERGLHLLHHPAHHRPHGGALPRRLLPAAGQGAGHPAPRQGRHRRPLGLRPPLGDALLLPGGRGAARQPHRLQPRVQAHPAGAGVRAAGHHVLGHHLLLRAARRLPQRPLRLHRARAVAQQGPSEGSRLGPPGAGPPADRQDPGCGDPGLCNLLVAFPHWQDHIYKHPGHQNDAVLPILQHLCPAAVLPECLHQSHPLQPHLTEVPGSSLQATAAMPAHEKGPGGNKSVQDLHRDQQWHKTWVNGRLRAPSPAMGFTRHSVQGRALPPAESHRKVDICQGFGSV